MVHCFNIGLLCPKVAMLNVMGSAMEEKRMSNLKNLKNVLGLFAYVLGFGLLDKYLGFSAILSLGLTCGIMIVILVKAPRETRIGILVGCILGFAALDLITGFSLPILGLQISLLSLLSIYVFWRMWAETGNDSREPSPSTPE